ncbi:MAG: DUF4118 domain-containing protein [Alphaproteobacteria bacterium]|nr:DUF4118 domain-containing protein [Alphaproteobacteria bacterium]
MENFRPLALTAAMVLLTTLIAHALLQNASIATVTLLFVPCVLIAALLWGPLHALVAVTLAIGAISYFRTPPVYSFYVDNPEHTLDIVVFALVATVVGGAADWARHSTESARMREARMRELYDFSRRVAMATDFGELPAMVARELGRLAQAPVALYRQTPDGPRPIAFDGDTLPGDEQHAAAAWIWKECVHLGRPISPRESGGWWLRAIGHGNEPTGLVAIHSDEFLQDVERVFIEAFLALAANVLERADLAARVDAIRIDQRAAELREAILSSISHDLRTPLAAILGSATTLERYGDLCTPGERVDLNVTIREEATRLDRLIARMFDLTRIRAGKLEPALGPVDLVDIVDVALRHNRRTLERHRVNVNLPADLAMPLTDGVLIEQALSNVVENAAKYAPAGTTIEIGAANMPGEPERVELSVRDEGRGLTPEQGRRIFDQFYRAVDGGADPGGSGLGLAISRAFVEACGGTIEATSEGLGRGTTVRMRLPAAKAPALAEEGEAA